MKKEIFINESIGETRIAIQEDGQLVEVYIEKQDNHRMVGNIYKGKVENVLPGMQAAFVDIGHDLNAFLPFSEILSEDYLIEDNDSDKNSKSKGQKNDNIEVDLKKESRNFCPSNQRTICWKRSSCNNRNCIAWQTTCTCSRCKLYWYLKEDLG